jgi:hypothetical protein
MTRPGLAFALLVATLCLTGGARAQDAPESNDSRFSFSRTGEGYLRLDSRTGQVSLCTRRAVGWACNPSPDERVVLEAEIGRLQSENASLKRELIARGLPLPDAIRPDAAPSKTEEPRLKLPGDAELRTVVSFLGTVWKRLVEVMVNIQNDVLKKT